MTEFEKLDDRLKRKGAITTARTMIDRASWTEEGWLLSDEEKAAELNKAMDAIDAGEWDPVDMNDWDREDEIDVKEYVAGLSKKG